MHNMFENWEMLEWYNLMLIGANLRNSYISYYSLPISAYSMYFMLTISLPTVPKDVFVNSLYVSY